MSHSGMKRLQLRDLGLLGQQGTRGTRLGVQLPWGKRRHHADGCL